MITIKNLGCEAFRGFVSVQQTREFPPRGFFGIRGRNLNTGGSSGAGKSSVTHLIAYLLGFSPFPATKQQSFLTKKPLQVWGVLDSPEGLVTIRRGKETSIQVGDEPLITGSVSKVNERLDKLFGVGPDLLRNLTYRPQRKPGLFLSLADADKKQFLSKVLGLEELRRQVKDSSKILADKRDIWIQLQAKVAALDSVAAPKPLFPKEPKGVELDGIFYSTEDIQITLSLVTADLAAQKVIVETAILNEREYREKERVRSTAEKEAIAARCHEYDLRREAEIKVLEEPMDPRHGPEYTQLQDGLKYADGRITEIKSTENKIRDEINSYRDHIASNEKILRGKPLCLDKINRAQEAIESLQKQECPTCKQKWLQASLRPYEAALAEGAEELATYEVLEASIEADKSTILSQGQRLEVVGKEVGEFMTVKDNIGAELKSVDQKYAAALYDHQKKKMEMVSAYQTDSRNFRAEASKNQVLMYEEIQRGLDGWQSAIEAERRKLAAIESKHRFCSGAFANMEIQYETAMKTYTAESRSWEKYCAEYDMASAARDVAVQQMNLETDYAAMVKGFLGAIFGEILDEVADEANMLLAGLPNVATTTLSFETEKEKADGSLDAAIIPVITRGGVPLDLEANLSGGQLAAVELAIDLAVSKVVQRRTGSAPGWLILDESFTGFDVPVVESCLELLTKAGQDLQIFIIDHNTEIKDLFTNTIDVVSENDVSRIEV